MFMYNISVPNFLCLYVRTDFCAYTFCAYVSVLVNVCVTTVYVSQCLYIGAYMYVSQCLHTYMAVLICMYLCLNLCALYIIASTLRYLL